MKAICLRARGGPEAFAYEEAPQPRPGEGEVLVRVHAAGVIPTELSWVPTWTTRAGEPRPLPVIPGHEFSGEIAALGAGVRDVGVGDLVYGLNDWYRDGAQAEYCVARVADFAHKPASVDHVHAAATPISALTAWQGLVERAGLAAGQRVLIHGAAGGVGTFAVQLARWRGARVTGTASAANLDFVRGLGADEVIDYRAERFEDVVRDVDVVFDTVGGETLEQVLGRAQARRKAGHRRRFRRTDDRRAHPCRVLHRGAEPDAAGGDRTADRRGCAPPGRWRRVPARRGAAGVPAQA